MPPGGNVDIAVSNLLLLYDTAGNESNSGVPGAGGVVLVYFFEGVTGAFTISLESDEELLISMTG